MRVSIENPFFFFNDTATTEIYTLSLHDALPISEQILISVFPRAVHDLTWPRSMTWTGLDGARFIRPIRWVVAVDRKSTRLNSSHLVISYAVFCLKKKTK